MTMKKAYILLTDTGTVLTRCIKLFTKKPYNHASLALDIDLNEVYSFGRKSASNPFNGGFVKEDMNTKIFQQANCTLYSFEVTEKQYNDIKQFIKSFENQKEDYNYNILGLFGFIFNKPIGRKNSYFCSQFVATVLKENEVAQFEKTPALIAPHDFQQISNFQLVFEGNLKNYLNDTTELAFNLVAS